MRGIWAGFLAVVLVAAVARAGEHVEVRYTRGLIAFQSGQYGDAIKTFDDVLREDPNHTGARYYRALAKARQGRLGDAIADLQEMQTGGAQGQAASSLGVAYFQTGRSAEAKQWLQRVAAEPASAGPANLLLGIIAYEEGDLRRAERHLAAAEADTDSRVKGSAAYYLGLVAMKESRTQDARNAFSQAQAAGEPAVAKAASSYLKTLGARPARREKPAATREPAGRLAVNGYVGLEYDSNLVLADIPASELKTTGIDKKSDGRFVLGAGALYHALAEPAVRIDLGYDLYQSVHFEVSKLDLQGHTVRATAEFGDGMIVPGIEGAYSFYLIDHDRTYFHELLGTPFILVEEGGIGQAEVFATVRGRDYLSKPFNPSRDAMNFSGGVRQTFMLGSSDRTADVGYQADREDPESTISGRDFDYWGHQIDAGVQGDLPLPGRITAGLRYGYRNEDYTHGNSRNPAVTVTLPGGSVGVSRLRRRDDIHWFAADLNAELSDTVYGRFGYWGRINDSNTAIFEYDRHIVSVTVGVRF